MGHRRGQPQVARGNRGLLRGVARDLPLDRPANGLGLAWVGLAVAVSVSNTAFELLSPRGTDDFTMASANALLCWAFGGLVY